MLHIVVDARLTWASGIGTYIRNVVPAVARLAPNWRFTLIVDRQDTRATSWDAMANVRVIHALAGIYTVREQLELAMRVPRDADLYWATHYNFPLLLRKPLVVTVHDLGHLRLPEFTKNVAKHTYARFMFRMIRKRALGLLFVSEFTRDEFQELVGRPHGSAAVVHHGVAPEWFDPGHHDPADPALSQPYFVYVGNIKLHKNLHTLLAAFEEVSRSIDARLVLIGRSENFRTADPAVQSRVASMPQVSLLGELEEPAVRRYVRHAAALVLPSLYEGFGLPALEAMAAGCPAIVSRAASLPEVCGDAAKYFDPRNAGELARLMLEVARDPGVRSTMVARGRAHARRFDWNMTAQKTHVLLESVVG